MSMKLQGSGWYVKLSSGINNDQKYQWPYTIVLIFAITRVLCMKTPSEESESTSLECLLMWIHQTEIDG